MNSTIFRQYDIRGKVGPEFTIEDSYTIARALAYYYKQQNPDSTTIAVGADGRTHSPAIKKQVCKALQDSGFNVLYIGTCPTPVLYFALNTLSVDGGIMITASHNGPAYNGFKISLGKQAIWGKQIQELKGLVEECKEHSAEQPGSYAEHELIPEYIAWIKQHFKHLVGFDKKFVIDCGNGAAGTVIPQLVTAMDWPNVEQLYCEVDGTYPNHEADPTVEENMLDVRNILQTTDNLFGVGFDGDCDRMAPMAKSGELVSGDKLLALYAQQVNKQYPGAGVVYDIKCSTGLTQLLSQWGMQPLVSPSGHSNIKDQMAQTGALLAGELSCHFFFKDRYFGYDDGFYAMLRLLELLQETGKTLDELLSVFPHRYATPELRVACPDEEKDTVVREVENYFVVQPNVRVDTIDGVRIETDEGWSLLRASNTQPVLCLRFEAATERALEQLQKELLEAMQPHFDVSELKKQLAV